ncbi:MAG: phosphatidate cytidylyltransferase [Lentisphaerae bacterium]|jgi:phosphatidate cytidylyltransferase|nr:phosphatidate cytidylyltransferase [Lentisphaerota bacterium]
MVKRVITGVAVAVFWLLVLRFLPGWVLFVLLQLFAALTLYEFYKLCEKGGVTVSKALGIAGGLLWITAVFAFPLNCVNGLPNGFPHESLLLGLLGFALLARLLFDPSAKDQLRNAAFTVLGFFYLPFMLSFYVRLAQWGATAPFEVTRSGIFLAFYVSLVVKMCDAGAYAFGMAFGQHGRHRMFPRISPKKSWEGFIGGMVFAMLSSIGAIWAARYCHWVPGGPLSGVSLGAGALMGLALGGIGVIGDLVESLFKRSVDAKDSGGYLPGMGGFLDVFDSLVFAPALACFYLSWFHV